MKVGCRRKMMKRTTGFSIRQGSESTGMLKDPPHVIHMSMKVNR
jgi:hypothetical protein